MLVCDLTLGTPAENLACDEALLEYGEGSGTEVLRLWESRQHFVVVGYGNRIETEVNLLFCLNTSLPILRRCTGGGTVVQGPGCFNYSLVLPFEGSGPLSTISGANAFILERHRRALTESLGRSVEREGQTDLAIGGLKFSGNAQRRRQNCLLFHGTFLLNFDFTLVEEALRMPSRQPDYRRNRSHKGFLTNLGVAGETIKQALSRAWGATQSILELPESATERTRQLAAEKYDNPEWNLKF